jgi:hypothetical protein
MLTPAQLTTLKAAILAETNPGFVTARTLGQTTVMRDFYNAEAVPAVQAWRSSVPPEETDEITPWVAFDSLVAGKRESWNGAFLRFPRDYSKAAVRKWITDTWGSATVGSNAETIMRGAGLRNITRAENVLGGTNTASTNTVSSRKLSWEGALTDADISAALEL